MGGSAKIYEEGIRISIKNELAYKGNIAGVASISDAEIDACSMEPVDRLTLLTRLRRKIV